MRLRACVVVVSTQKRRGTRVRSDGALERSWSVRGILVTLAPRCNCRSSTSQEGCTARRLNGNWDIVERKVLDNETVGCRGRLVRTIAGLDSDWCAGDRTVDQGNGLGSRHVNSQLAVVDADPLVNPLPRETTDDGCHAVVEYQVAHRVLLIANVCANQSAVEGQVSEESSRTY